MAIPRLTQRLLGKKICKSASLNELWHGTAIALFAVVAILSFPLFIYFSFSSGRSSLAFVLISFWLLSIMIYAYMLNTQDIRSTSLVSSLICILLFFYLLITGAVENTGILWCYVVVPVLFQILGPRNGSIAILMLLVGACLIFYLPQFELLKATYTSNQKSRFVFSFSVLSALSFVHEYARTQANLRLNELKDQFQQASHRDTLTQLANRREARDRLKLIESLTTDPKYVSGIVLADIDFFKKINDGFGHDCGDYVLIHLAQVLEKSTRDEDLVVRWGGEEFLLILPNTDLQQSVNVCHNIQDKILAENFAYNNKKINVSLSFGVSYLDNLQSANSALVKADQALYRAKKQGRNCIVSE